ncbi:hypothetical protein BO94DRAFT_605172 [Aspergillus sclerotioniger CBS 115572]|uniref:Uncharacterized protein n=1 Tax=Aspergillus sclerotioniger CBS 115572 TaxID=1450535 RepID=A0A317VNR0_9EURO|nr:hypothetical protein BO94DRAFT_605172 [Aspergillus sclerotioniger CBS 115572]PWY76004.1 hypothetical protein BO94DRAFT_605172 [Aspergillus sclerotioniger CBS 115572]
MKELSLSFRASDFESFGDFTDHIKQMVLTASNSLDVTYSDVRPVWSDYIFDIPDPVINDKRIRKNYNSRTETFHMKIMPPHIHNCHHAWQVWTAGNWRTSGLLTIDEKHNLTNIIGTTLNFTHGPYSRSRKEPDFCMIPSRHHLPSIAVESGWSENYNQLRADMDLWLVGGITIVQLVFILNWTKRLQHVSGTVEVWSLHPNGIPVCRQTETIFPRPRNNQTQVINITHRQLFSGHCFPNCRPDGVLPYRVDDLRTAAENALSYMDLKPAQ